MYEVLIYSQFISLSMKSPLMRRTIAVEICEADLISRLDFRRLYRNEAPYADVPKPRRNKSERKAYPTPMKTLIERAKAEIEARKLQPCRVLDRAPDNGLLVPELIDVAHRVYRARRSLLGHLSDLIRAAPIHRCRYCFEVHVGESGHEIRSCTGPASGSRSAQHVWRKGAVQDVIFFPKCFHLFDRAVKPRVTHNERRAVPRIPAILELCIQAGLDLPDYPTRRRTRPVYSIDGRIVDYKSADDPPKRISTDARQGTKDESDDDGGGSSSADLGCRALDSWFEMRRGAEKMMREYSVVTCGYCPEVQVGPKGHKVRMCRASKHQSRDGLHAWQEATLDDLVGPNYVWHVNGSPLHNNLKRYYGKAPAVVELCVQAGAPVPDEYRSMMRLDVVPPDRDEADLVA